MEHTNTSASLFSIGKKKENINQITIDYMCTVWTEHTWMHLITFFPLREFTQLKSYMNTSYNSMQTADYQGNIAVIIDAFVETSLHHVFSPQPILTELFVFVWDHHSFSWLPLVTAVTMMFTDF